MEHSLKDGQPCGHPGCLSHITHPCEGCGRIGGVTMCRICGKKPVDTHGACEGCYIEECEASEEEEPTVENVPWEKIPGRLGQLAAAAERELKKIERLLGGL